MVSSTEIISIIKNFSLAERFRIIEEILKNIREESTSNKVLPINAEPLSIMSLAGVFDEKEAEVFGSAIDESRKIDHDEW